jgi:hypothetical protein
MATGQLSRSQIDKLVSALEKVQTVYIEVLEAPAGRLMDCLLQLSAHFYTMTSNYEGVLTNDLAVLALQNSKAVYNPALALAV